MNQSPKDSLIVVLLCVLCVLGTYVYLTDGKSSCKCDNAKVIEKLDTIERKIDGRRIGSPAGSPLGSPLGSP